MLEPRSKAFIDLSCAGPIGVGWTIACWKS